MIKISKATAQLTCIGLQRDRLTESDRDEIDPEILACYDFDNKLKLHLEMAIEKVERTKIPEMILIQVEP